MSLNIPQLLRAAGGAIIGKVRLQKIVYLLDQVGLDSGFDFSYHHYGPYSTELSNALDDAIIFDEVVERVRARASDGVPYSVFEIGEEAGEPPDENRIGDLDFDVAREAVRLMNVHSATVLELAATIHWLAFVEDNEDWLDELHRRKGIKAASGRTQEALDLLEGLGLAPSDAD